MFRPLEDRVIIKPRKQEDRTASGIVLPENAKEKPVEGDIEFAGPGRMDDKGKRIPMDVKVGDRVIYSKYAGTEFKQGDVEYLILKQSDILAIVSSGK
ncbi:co-chaperone GroES [Pasteuria penetrans]|uniref:co-chaperone GroES n=1 Tax=Pasteuria penetrans TaxID=86005 RepID=UPI000FB7BB4C|nr:co-chaperone GroES [Pasteuria penetrans]